MTAGSRRVRFWVLIGVAVLGLAALISWLSMPRQSATGLTSAAAERGPVLGPTRAGRAQRVLIIGGGSSHKFGEFFGKADSAILRAAGYTVNYTEDRDQAATELAGADVAAVVVVVVAVVVVVVGDGRGGSRGGSRGAVVG